MDIVPNEPSAELNKASILVPKDVAKAFGRALRQNMSSDLQEISALLGSLTEEPNYQRMENAFKKMSRVLDRLEKAKEVRIVLSGAGNDFEFSEETEEEEPKQGELLMNKNITPKFVSALNHNIRNSLHIVSGFAEKARSEEAKRIVNACSQIENVIVSLHDTQEIRISTDNKGYAEITPIRYAI